MNGRKLDDKGYSLVELIIVIAIIAMLSVASFLTMNYLRTAKAKESAVTFETEISSLSTRARNQACKFKLPSDSDITLHADAKFCIKIYKDTDGRIYAQKGYKLATGSYFYPASENNNDGKGASLTGYIDVKYVANGTTTDIDNTGITVVFDKTGRCVEGNGTYEFYKRNSYLISRVVINKNGSHRVD